MSDPRRATLTPFGKSDKKLNKLPDKTFRFSFTLGDPKENSCPVFDYCTVVKSEERKLRKKRREEKVKKANGVLDGLEDDDEDVRKLAAQFEEVYGGKKGKSKSYADLGAGYDETDPFIDNTEAQDEELGEDLETPCGGYYINSGPLELKRVEMSDQSDGDELAKRRLKRNELQLDQDSLHSGYTNSGSLEHKRVDQSEHSDFNEINKRRHKRMPQVIEDDDEEDENKETQSAEKENGVVAETKPFSNEMLQETKKPKVSSERSESEEKAVHVPISNDSEETIKKKKKRVLTDEATAGGSQIKVKKAKTVKTLLEEKRVHETAGTEELKKVSATSTSITEAIESVVNASNNDENSNSSNSMHSASGSTSTSGESAEERPSAQVVPPQLPSDLSPELLALVDQIKHTASITDNTRKTFCTDINNSLIKLEWKSREFSAANRNLLFSHLAHFLPCTKETLMRRAKKLFIHKEESHMDTIICKLKATIDATMPTLREKYDKDCQRIAEEKGLTGNASNGTAPGADNQQTPESAGVKLPKRKFPWTEETRGYLREIVRLKQRCFKVLKLRKNTSDEYVNSFFNTKIRTLWPPGWMKISTLWRESRGSPHSGKSRHSSTYNLNKSDSSRLNVPVRYSSASPSNNAASLPLYVSPSPDPQHQPIKSPIAGSTPLAAKPQSLDPLNLLSKISTSFSTSPSQPKKAYSPGHHQSIKTELSEPFSMDCLLKRTSESASCNDYNTTLSDLMKNDSVIMNGASLPLKNVNSSQINDSVRSEKILDLSSCNSSVSGTPSVIQSVPINERTTMRASDSVSLNANTPDSSKRHSSTPSPCRKEVNTNLPLNRKQRLLQQNTQSNWHSQGSCDNMIKIKTDHDFEWPQASPKGVGASAGKEPQEVERRLSDETTTATDILSQIISDSLLAPSQYPYSIKGMEEVISKTPPTKDQELLYDVMQDLKELNNLSGGGSLDSKSDMKKNNYGKTSWSQPKPSEPIGNPFHNEFLKHLLNNQETSLPPATTIPLSRSTVNPYESLPYMNEINKSVYNPSPHRSNQSISSHAGSHSSKVSQINQGCIMKTLPNISSGHPHRYMGQMDYPVEDQHNMLGLTSSMQYSLPGWYTGNEPQSHQ